MCFYTLLPVYTVLTLHKPRMRTVHGSGAILPQIWDKSIIWNPPKRKIHPIYIMYWNMEDYQSVCSSTTRNTRVLDMSTYIVKLVQPCNSSIQYMSCPIHIYIYIYIYGSSMGLPNISTECSLFGLGGGGGGFALWKIIYISKCIIRINCYPLKYHFKFSDGNPTLTNDNKKCIFLSADFFLSVTA